MHIYSGRNGRPKNPAKSPFGRRDLKIETTILYIIAITQKNFWHRTPTPARGINNQNKSNIAIFHRKSVISSPPQGLDFFS